VTTVREIASSPAAALERAESWASGRRAGPRLVIAASDLDVGALGPVPGDNGRAISLGFAHLLTQSQTGRTRVGLPQLLPAAAIESTGLPELSLSPLNRSYQDSISRMLVSGRIVATGLAAAMPDSGAEALEPLTATLARILRSSGRLAIASDAPRTAYGAGVHDEMQLLARAGLPAAQVLRLATAGGALALGLDGQLGTLEAGKLADFIIVDGDPLARIEDLRQPSAVARGGVWYTAEQLRVRR
jgi:hypothetical protein